MRIVIDTNILIAALTKPTGSGAQILKAWREGQVEIVASEQTLREAEAILGGGWLRRLTSRDAVEQLLEQLRARCILVRPRPIAGIELRDEGDRRLVDAGVEGDAGYLVTADRELLRYAGYGGMEVVTSTEFLRLLRGQKDGSDEPSSSKSID